MRKFFVAMMLVSSVASATPQTQATSRSLSDAMKPVMIGGAAGFGTGVVTSLYLVARRAFNDETRQNMRSSKRVMVNHAVLVTGVFTIIGITAGGIWSAVQDLISPAQKPALPEITEDDEAEVVSQA